MTLDHDPMSDSNENEFDSEELLDRIDGDKSLFREIVGIFIQDTPSLISALGDGISQGSAETVEKAAHTIKGSCAMMSAKRLGGLAHQLEMNAREKNLSGAKTLYRSIIECFNDLKMNMAAVLEKMDL
jgi:HPt (histidine-containing phosphotransfer) domain-containing protein